MRLSANDVKLMREATIVDGYNLIFFRLQGKAPGKEFDMAHARDRLLNQLAQYAALTGVDVVVVFDAYRVKGGKGSVEQRDDVTVIFTAEGEAADTVIERLAAQLAGSFTVSVVTADRAEQRMVLGHGALRIPPREFDAMVAEVIQRYRNQESVSSRPGDDSVESRLTGGIRKIMAKWRLDKGRI
ncbi:MAG: NYN domain-containing protein [Bacillota bacterium]